jgi:hypothetical protein
MPWPIAPTDEFVGVWIPLELDVALVIFVTEKRLLSAVSALSDMMRKARCDNMC